jgi:hypothetical protein
LGLGNRRNGREGEHGQPCRVGGSLNRCHECLALLRRFTMANRARDSTANQHTRNSPSRDSEGDGAKRMPSHLEGHRCGTIFSGMLRSHDHAPALPHAFLQLLASRAQPIFDGFCRRCRISHQ